jgi:hypothetical protein
MTHDFFTRPLREGYRVPHDPVGVRKILIVHQAIIRSFEIIRAEGSKLGSESENQVTEKLEDVLENRIRNRNEVDGFNSLFFGKVTRGSEVVNFNGMKISKKPDLVFSLRREDRLEWDQRQDALFAECKPVDKKHPLNGHYCAVGKDCTGIERFIIGDYAWAMEEALMIGYVRNGLCIHPHLADALNDACVRSKLGNPSSLETVGTSVAEPKGLYRTKHQRTFKWRDGREASPIDIFHSWHDCI